jgi:hypothetical protein
MHVAQWCKMLVLLYSCRANLVYSSVISQLNTGRTHCVLLGIVVVAVLGTHIIPWISPSVHSMQSTECISMVEDTTGNATLHQNAQLQNIDWQLPPGQGNPDHLLYMAMQQDELAVLAADTPLQRLKTKQEEAMLLEQQVNH